VNHLSWLIDWSISMGWDYVSELLLPLTDILFIPQMIWVWRVTVEWYWQGKTEELGEKPVPVPFCPPQIPHGLTRARTRVSEVRGWRLTAWAMARPNHLSTPALPSTQYESCSQARIKGFVGPWNFSSLGPFGDSRSIVGTTVYSRLSGLMEGEGMHR
jgi:hypothetical protein